MQELRANCIPVGIYASSSPLTCADIKAANKKHRNERLNRSLQNFMYSVIGDDNEAAAKKSLAVCTELWRRHIWRDARTVNVIGGPRVFLFSRYGFC